VITFFYKSLKFVEELGNHKYFKKDPGPWIYLAFVCIQYLQRQSVCLTLFYGNKFGVDLRKRGSQHGCDLSYRHVISETDIFVSESCYKT
jgi:hypothetical protein